MSNKSYELFYQFMWASVQDRDLARRLLREHPDLIGATNKSGETALHYLAVENYLDAVRFLIEFGANVNSHNKYGTPLLDAASLGYEEMVKLLLAHGADPGATSLTGGSVLHCASRSGNAKVTALILKSIGGNADTLNDLGETPLMVAAASDATDVIQLLLSHGADPNAIAQGDKSALSVAIEAGHPTVVETLIQGGARMDQDALLDSLAKVQRKRKRPLVFEVLQRHKLIQADTEIREQ